MRESERPRGSAQRERAPLAILEAEGHVERGGRDRGQRRRGDWRRIGRRRRQGEGWEGMARRDVPGGRARALPRCSGRSVERDAERIVQRRSPRSRWVASCRGATAPSTRPRNICMPLNEYMHLHRLSLKRCATPPSLTFVLGGIWQLRASRAPHYRLLVSSFSRATRASYVL